MALPRHSVAQASVTQGSVTQGGVARGGVARGAVPRGGVPRRSTTGAAVVAIAVVLLHAPPDAASTFAVSATTADRPDGSRLTSEARLTQTTTQIAAPGSGPRIAPIDEATATADQRALLRRADTSGTGANELRTYAHHPVLATNLLPFAHYLAAASTLPPRHRALLILRTAWLCRSAYAWAHFATAVRRTAADSVPFGVPPGGVRLDAVQVDGARLESDDLARIARGPDAPGWQPFEATLLRVADEQHWDAFVSDATWQALTREYDTQRTMDAVFTVAELTMIAGTVNSLRLPVEADTHDRLPIATIPYVWSDRPQSDRLIGKAARIRPLEPSEWTPEVRAWLDRANTGRPVAAIYRTYARHLAMDKPRTLVSEHIRQTSTLSGRIRELLILRIGWLCRSEYEWAAHAPAGRRAGLTDADFARIVAPPSTGALPDDPDQADASLLRAVDELHRNDVVSDATWDALATHFDTRQLLDVLTTIGGYRMVSMALNTFGVQLEPGAERFPF
jgi:4-carboxymuconolactone decarboxylase